MRLIIDLAETFYYYRWGAVPLALTGALIGTFFPVELLLVFTLIVLIGGGIVLMPAINSPMGGMVLVYVMVTCVPLFVMMWAAWLVKYVIGVVS